MSKYTILWEVDDGYCGGSRPQKTIITTDDFDEFMDEGDIEMEIEQIVEEDFRQLISHYIKTDLSDIIKSIQEELSEGED